MWQFGAAAGQLIVQLPVLIVLIAGFVVVANRRRSIGGRRATMTLAGLAVLTVDVVLGTLWSVALPALVVRGNLGMTQVGGLSAVIGFLFAAMLATAVGLFVAAIVTPAAPQPPTA